jgi:hypothetical protein
VTFRRVDTDTAGAPVTLHRATAGGTEGVDADQMRVAIGDSSGLFTPATSALSWTDGDRVWSLQGDVGLSQLVEIATEVDAS